MFHLKCTVPSTAIVANSGYGPVFGDHDICIFNNSNTNNKNFSNLGHTFKHPNFAYGSNEAKSFLAGSCNFLTNEIEVYTKE